MFLALLYDLRSYRSTDAAEHFRSPEEPIRLCQERVNRKPALKARQLFQSTSNQHRVSIATAGGFKRLKTGVWSSEKPLQVWLVF